MNKAFAKNIKPSGEAGSRVDHEINPMKDTP